MKAVWNNVVIAESDDTVVVEGNHYFPKSALQMDHFEPSTHTSVCPWKGTAQYFNIVVSGETNQNAAWFYQNTKPKAAEIEDRVAFWKGVTVES